MAQKVSPSLRAYRNLQKAKKQFCAGKVAKSAVKAQASNYVTSAVAAGKTKGDAEKTARKVMNSGCKMTSAITGRKKKTTTRKATTRRKTTRK